MRSARSPPIGLRPMLDSDVLVVRVDSVALVLALARRDICVERDATARALVDTDGLERRATGTPSSRSYGPPALLRLQRDSRLCPN